MSEGTHTPSPAPRPPTRSARIEEIGFGVLLLLSLGGIAVSDFSRDWGLTYWLVMVPLFSAASIYSAWTRARSRNERLGRRLWVQLLHWSVLALAVWAIFLFERTGRLNRDDAGLVALLAVALTTILAGVHFDWRLAVLGVLLGLAAGAAAMVEEFFWMLLIPALLLGAAALLWQRRREKPTPPGP
jgi:hypothetical protein